MSEFKPREWQQHGADQCVSLARSGADRALIYACPGSGKTFGGLLIASDLIRRAKLSDIIVVVTPNLAIKSQWIKRAHAMGLELMEIEDATELRQSGLPFGAHGYIVSYQQAVNIWLSLRHFCEERKPIVILDEVHHTSTGLKDRDGNAWGETVSRAFAAAAFKVCTTGTPFRQGNHPIAFVHYNEVGEATAQVRYTYANAIQDGVCRPIDFVFYDGEITWLSRAKGASVTAEFTDRLTKRLVSERLEAAVSTDGQLPAQMLTAAHAKLMAIRAGCGVDATAGGLVVANDTLHADAIAAVLESISGVRPIVVHNKIDDAQEMIGRFRDGTMPWIVGVSMLSEGVDIPRLRVGVYLSRIKAALYFHQFCGRFARVQQSRRERSFIFLPRDEDIEEIAREIETEKCHALGEELPVRPRRGRGNAKGGRDGLVVIDSDGTATLNVFGGMAFPAAYVEHHRALVGELKHKNPTLHDMPVAEVLKLLVDTGRIAAPSSEAA